MSYHIYTTEGIILSSRPLREADRVYSILARDLGLIRATAAGVRKEVSKLRGSLEPFSLSTVSFVKGKEYWRLTSALLEESPSTIPVADRRPLARVFALVERLVQGEEKHEELFDELNAALAFVRTSPPTPLLDERRGEHAEALEYVLALRVLFLLGYIAKEDIAPDFLEASLSPELLSAAFSEKKKLVDHINAGIYESGLA